MSGDFGSVQTSLTYYHTKGCVCVCLFACCPACLSTPRTLYETESPRTLDPEALTYKEQQSCGYFFFYYYFFVIHHLLGNGKGKGLVDKDT